MSAGFAELVRDGRHTEAIDQALRSVIEAAGGDLSLSQELGGLRLVLTRVVAVDGLDADPYQTAHTVASLVETITQVVRAQRLVTGGAADDLAAAVDRVLDELGLGG